MAILETEVLVSLYNNHAYYIKLGYDIPSDPNIRGKYNVKKGTELLVKIEDLPENSNMKVTKICDLCGDVKKNVLYFSIMKQRKNNDGKDYCKKCANRLRMIKNAKNNSLLLKHPSVAREWIKCLEIDCENYTPEMVNVKSNYVVLWKCSDCNYEWESKISDRANGSGCPACYGRAVSDKNRLSLLFPELINEWHYTKNGDLTPYDVTYASHIEVWWKCKNGHEWKTPVHTRTIMKCGCPECSETKGEKRIRKWLEENDFLFTPQKEFNGLTGIRGGNLRYDFYLPTQNILIEYQGEFHDGNGNEYVKDKLEYQQEHDRRKCEYAKQNNINLLEIWYWEFNRIEEILIDKLGGIKWQLN